MVLGCGTAGPQPCRQECASLYSETSPFNVSLPADPRLVPGSQQIVRAMLAEGPIPDLVVAPPSGSDWSHPLYWTAPSDPEVRVHCTEPWGRCELEGLKVRVPAHARPSDSSDAHLAVLDRATGFESDFWHVQHRDDGQLVVGWGGRTRLDGDGLGSDATAAHFGLAAGVIRAQELVTGHIDHALFLVVGCVGPTVVWPAQGRGRACTSSGPAPSTGQHLWLDLSPEQIDALLLPPWKRAILLALATYGGFVGDTGGRQSLGVVMESEVTWASRGRVDPRMVFADRLARQPGSGVHMELDGSYRFDLASHVDWNRLQVVDPCVSQRRC